MANKLGLLTNLSLLTVYYVAIMEHNMLTSYNHVHNFYHVNIPFEDDAPRIQNVELR